MLHRNHWFGIKHSVASHVQFDDHPFTKMTKNGTILSTMKPTRFNVIIREDDACYIAECVGNSVNAQGNTIEATLDNLKEALELYYKDEDFSIETEAFSLITAEGNTYRPGLVRKKTSEKRASDLESIFYWGKGERGLGMRQMGIDEHRWLMRIPVLGHIYALILLFFLLCAFYGVLQVFLDEQYFVALVGIFALAFLTWLLFFYKPPES